MQSSTITVLALLLSAPLLVTTINAQDVRPITDERPISISFVPGVVSGASDTGPSIGGRMEMVLSNWVAFEGTGTYAERGSGTSALDLHAGVLLTLPVNVQHVRPYAAAGIGLYRATFDMDAPRFLGGLSNSWGPGVTPCAGTGTCPYGEMPAFYGRRLGPIAAPAVGGGLGTRTFVDPAFSLGGGARLDLGPHLFVRPEARALFIRGDGQTETLGTFSFAFGYRF